MKSKVSQKNNAVFTDSAAPADAIMAVLNDSRKVLVASHIDPDGDALGTQLAFAAFLTHLGKEVYLVRDNDIPWRYRFLHGVGDIPSVEEYRELLSELRYTVKGFDNVSDAYIQAIQTGWMNMVNHLKSGNFSRDYVNKLMEEGQVWLNRSRALEAGQLQLVQCHAVMQRGPKRALSDAMKID